MVDLGIVPLDAGDVSAFLSLQARSFGAHGVLFDISVWTRETPEELLAELSNAKVLVAKNRNGDILGGVRGRDVEGVWLIRKLFVAPGFQGGGIGSSLMAAIEQQIPEHCHKISVCTMLVLGENVRFFLGRGYEPEYLMPDHYNRLHLLCFRKRPEKRF